MICRPLTKLAVEQAFTVRCRDGCFLSVSLNRHRPFLSLSLSLVFQFPAARYSMGWE
jgi:hypothetical protein